MTTTLATVTHLELQTPDGTVETYLTGRRASSPMWRGSRFADTRIRRAIALLRAHPNKELNMDELASAGVRVNAVCPASVDTPLLRGFALPDDADLQLIMRSVSPMGGLIDAGEVAAAVAYLASGEAANVSGTTLVIDGAASA